MRSTRCRISKGTRGDVKRCTLPRNSGRSREKMKTTRVLIALILAVSGAIVSAQGKRRDDLKKPLVLASQGSFFVGGETKAVPAAGPGPAGGGGDITINQMYVQYQTP